MNPGDNEVSDDPHLEGRTHSLEVGNRPLAYALEEEIIWIYVVSSFTEFAFILIIRILE
jgi:hypothetical protein